MASRSATNVVANDFRPYIAAVFLESSSSKRGASLATAILKEMEIAVKSTPTVTRSILSTLKTAKHGNLHCASLVVEEKRIPAWFSSGTFKDKSHQLAIVAVTGSMVALVVSENALRDAMLAEIREASVVSRSRMAAAFIGNHAKTVWLSGIHSSTNVKADSKTLTGTALEFALDPLGDQSYALSAIRSSAAVPGLASGARGATRYC